jgi:hypothetical protein
MNRLCECGCGKEITNEKNSYILGHTWKNKKISEQQKIKAITNRKLNQKLLKLINNIELPLCKCGCGKKVNNHKNTFINGHNTKTEETKQKKIITSLKKRGVQYSHQDPSVQYKCIQTSLKNHGTEYVFQSENIKNKIKQTNIKTFGFEYASKSKIVRDKVKKTNIEKFGGVVPYCSSIVKEKGKQTCIEHYGVDNYAKTFEFRQFAREQMISFIECGLKDGKTFTPTKGKNEKPFISELQKYTSYFIDNDFKIIGYFPDGYIKELNLVIEFDEPWHLNTWSKNHDIQKDEDYKKIRLTVFRVSEKDWKENKQQITENFIFITKQLELENEFRKFKTNFN